MAIEDTFAALYLRECGGNVEIFVKGVEYGNRVGQAFFNALSHEDREKLRETPHDPYHGGVGKVTDAIDFLTLPTIT